MRKKMKSDESNSEENKVFEVVKYIIKLLNEKNFSPNITKIQKLLFFCDAQYMINNEGISMFQNDFQAWNLGPVVPGVYTKYKFTSPLVFGEMQVVKSDYRNLNEREKSCINDIIQKYGKLNAQELVNKTHIEGGPWYKTYNNVANKKEGMFGRYCTSIIPKTEIYKYYKNNPLI